MEVLKRSGRKQKFNLTKLEGGILKAAKEARLKPDQAKRLAKEISLSIKKGLKGKRIIKAVELRERVLRRLDAREKKVSAAWRKFDRKRR